MDVPCAFPPGPDAPRLARLAEGCGHRRASLYDPAALRPDGLAPQPAAVGLGGG